MSYWSGKKLSKQHKSNISKSILGIKRGPLSELHRAKLRKAKLGKTKSKSNNWKGKEATYRSVHVWVVRNYGKPNTCEYCKKTNLYGHSIHWASTGDWRKRARRFWKRLCAKCHGEYDALKRKNNK